MEMTEVPRTLLRQGLRGMRLPLDVAETVARRMGVDLDEHWLPSVAFEGFEGEAKRLVGSLLRDDELSEEGRRQRARAAELRQALQLEAVADGTRARADQRLRRRREAASEQRKAITEAARRSEHVVEEKRRRGHTQARREAERLERQAEAVDERRDDKVADLEREARRRELVEETAALELQQRAVDAEATARALEKAEERVKEQRKANP